MATEQEQITAADVSSTVPAPAFSSWVMTAALLVLLVVYISVKSSEIVQEMFRVRPAAGYLFLLAAAVAVGVASWRFVRALERYRRLQEVVSFREEVKQLLGEQPRNWSDSQLIRWMQRYAARLERRSDVDLRRAILAMREEWDQHLGARRMAQQLDKHLLRRLDDLADRAIQTNAATVAIGTAVSNALLDTLLVLWRTLTMIDEIASIYGSRPGLLGSLRLLRRGLYLMVVAAVADEAAGALVGTVGNRGLAALSGRLAQGTGNGLLLIRLGHAVKRDCRPMPLQDSVGTLKQLMMLLTQVGRHVFSKPTAEKSAS
jgi:putative membrane protein